MSVEIVNVSHNRWQVVREGEGLALLRWSGEHMVLELADRTELGTLYRSDGKWQTAADGTRFIAYTWRAYRPNGAEAARRVDQVTAVAMLLPPRTCAEHMGTLEECEWIHEIRYQVITGADAFAGIPCPADDQF